MLFHAASDTLLVLLVSCLIHDLFYYYIFYRPSKIMKQRTVTDDFNYLVWEWFFVRFIPSNLYSVSFDPSPSSRFGTELLFWKVCSLMHGTYRWTARQREKNTKKHSFSCLLDFRPSITLPEHFYCPSTEKEALRTMHRDISSYEKYTLSDQTKQAMKNINFDVWQWEPNEVKLDDITKNKKEINMSSI